LVAIDDCRDAAIRIDAEELGRLLVAGKEVHDVHLVRHAELLERDGGLVPVRGGGGVGGDYPPSFPPGLNRVNLRPGRGRRRGGTRRRSWAPEAPEDARSRSTS